MTMKIMISTSKISMSGTTFGVDNEPWPSPTSIPIASLLRTRSRASPRATQPRRVGIRRGFKSINKRMANTRQKLAARKRPPDPTASISRGRTRGCSRLLHPLGEQPELVHTGGTNLVHHGNDVAVFRPRIASDVNGLVETARYPILDRARDFILGHLGAAKVNPAIASNGYSDRIVLVGILHVAGILGEAEVDRNVLGQHRRDHHKDDQQDEHDVRHGDHIGGRHLCAGLWFVRHGNYLFAPRRRMK